MTEPDKTGTPERRSLLFLPRPALAGIGAATAAAHIGNNFTTFLIGGLIDRYGFTPVQMGVWSMTETLSYAVAMFIAAPRAAALSPRILMGAAGLLVVTAQFLSATTGLFTVLLPGRIVTGFGYGLANVALNLAAGRTSHPARTLSAGIALQTALYTLVNLTLPLIGVRFGVAGMFVALAILSACLCAAAPCLPDGPASTAPDAARIRHPRRISPAGWRMLAAMALFTFGSLAIWPFMERTAHAIGLSAFYYGCCQSIATLGCAVGNIVLATRAGHDRGSGPVLSSLVICAVSCAALTTVSRGIAFALALVIFNVSWFFAYPLMLGTAFAVEPDGRLAVLCSGVWLLMMSLGSVTTGLIAWTMGGYGAVGPAGMVVCLAAAFILRPLVRKLASVPPTT